MTRCTHHPTGWVMGVVACGGILLSGSLAQAQPEPFVPPEKPEPARYQELAARPLFGLPTEEPEAPIETGTPFLQRYQLVYAAHFDGTDYVTIQDRQENRSVRLNNREPGPDGWRVLGVDWSEDLQETKVQVEKGQEGGVLSFSREQLFQTTSAPAPSPPRGAANQQANLPPGMPNPPPGAAPALPENVRRAIEANQSPTVPAGQIRRRTIRPPSEAGE